MLLSIRNAFKERFSQIGGAVLTHDKIEEKELWALVKAAISESNPAAVYRQTTTGFKLEPGRPLPW